MIGYLLLMFAALLVERSFGLSFIFLPLIIVVIFSLTDDERPFLMLLSGVMADLFFGRKFGVTSILFLFMSLEISLFSSKFESKNLGVIFLSNILLLAQASLLWGREMRVRDYIFHSLVGVIMWIVSVWWKQRGYGKDLYLRR